MAKPLVSILMPLYNAEQWVMDTIQCCLDQTYHNWELIVVDDGSTDNSCAIVGQIKEYDSRIKLFRQKNSGACVARNTAFKHCKGDYVMYLDADDLISPDKIENQVHALSNEGPQSIAICAWEEFQATPSPTLSSRAIYKSYKNPIELLIEMWSDGSMLQTSCYLVPRNLITSSNGWDKNITLNDDGEFFCRIIAKASKIVFVTNSAVYYRRGHTSLSTSEVFSETKQISRLNSFISYENTILSVTDSPRIRKVLARNYSLVATCVPPSSRLFKDALNRIKALGVKPFHPYPQTLLGRVSAIFGFPLTMRLRHILLKLLKRS